MKIVDVGAAVGIVALLGWTWLGPTLVKSVVSDPVIVVGSGERDSISAPAGEVSFVAPSGWNKQTTGRLGTAIYTSGDKSLYVEVVDGVTDIDRASQRRLAALSQAGITAAFDGAAATAGDGFTGKRCVAIQSSSKSTGTCAIVAKKESMVSVVSLGQSFGTQADLQPLLDSLELAKNAEDGDE